MVFTMARETGWEGGQREKARNSRGCTEWAFCRDFSISENLYWPVLCPSIPSSPPTKRVTDEMQKDPSPLVPPRIRTPQTVEDPPWPNKAALQPALPARRVTQPPTESREWYNQHRVFKGGLLSFDWIVVVESLRNNMPQRLSDGFRKGFTVGVCARWVTIGILRDVPFLSGTDREYTHLLYRSG